MVGAPLWGIGEPLPQKCSTSGNPPGLYSLLPSLATKDIPVPGPTFFADPGDLCHGEIHSELVYTDWCEPEKLAPLQLPPWVWC